MAEAADRRLHFPPLPNPNSANSSPSLSSSRLEPSAIGVSTTLDSLCSLSAHQPLNPASSRQPPVVVHTDNVLPQEPSPTKLDTSFCKSPIISAVNIPLVPSSHGQNLSPVCSGLWIGPRRLSLFSGMSSRTGRGEGGANGADSSPHRRSRFLRMPLRLIIIILLCVFTVGPSLTSWMLSWQTGSEGLNTLLDLSQSSLEEVSLQLRSLLIERASDAVMKMVEAAETSMELTALHVGDSEILEAPTNGTIWGYPLLAPFTDETGYMLIQNPLMLLFSVRLLKPADSFAMTGLSTLDAMAFVRVGTTISFVTLLMNDARNSSAMSIYAVDPVTAKRDSAPAAIVPSLSQDLTFTNTSIALPRTIAWNGDITFNAYIGTPSMVLHAQFPFSDHGAALQVEVHVNTYSISAFLRSLLLGPKERMFLAFRNPLGHLVGASHGKFFSHSDVDFTKIDALNDPAPIQLFRQYTALDSNDELIRQGAQWLMNEYQGWDAIPEVNTAHDLLGEKYWIASKHTETKFQLELQLVLFADRASRMGKIEASQHQTLQNISKTNVRLIIILSFLVAIAIGLAFLLSFVLTHSLNRLAKGMDALAMLEFRSRRSSTGSQGSDLPDGSRFSELFQLEASYISLERGLRAFVKYVPRDVVKMMLTGEMESENIMTRRVITILFMDIAGFSSLCEKVSPDVLMKVTTSYLQAMCESITDSGGVLDKFIGDCIMAMWNAPKRLTAHEAAACDAALEMQSKLMTLASTQWAAEGLPELRFRVGINTDRVLVGNFGCDYRINFTCLGDGVNLASRLEAANKNFGTVVLVSATTKFHAGMRFSFRKIARITVPGKSEVLPVFELLYKRSTLPILDEVELTEVPKDEENPTSKGTGDTENQIRTEPTIRGEAPGAPKDEVMAPTTSTSTSATRIPSAPPVAFDPLSPARVILGSPKNTLTLHSVSSAESYDVNPATEWAFDGPSASASPPPAAAVVRPLPRSEEEGHLVLFHWEYVDLECLMEMTRLYEKGLELFGMGLLMEAEQYFLAARQVLPADGACEMLLDACHQGKDLTKRWDGVLRFDKK